MHSYLDTVPSPSPSFASMDPRRVADIELDSVFMAQHEHTLRARNLPRVPASPTSVPSSPASASFYTPSEQAKRPFRRLPEPPKPKMRRLPEPPMPSPRSVRSFASSSSAQSSASSSSSGSSDSAYTSYLTFDDDSDSDSDSLDEPSDFTWSYVEFQGKAFPLPQTSIPSTSSRHRAHHRTNSRSPLSQPPTTHSHSKQRSHLSPPNHSTSQILREIGAKELEPIGPAMEPAIFADDGAQGDWRQLVDDLFMRD